MKRLAKFIPNKYCLMTGAVGLLCVAAYLLSPAFKQDDTLFFSGAMFAYAIVLAYHPDDEEEKTTVVAA